MPGTASQAASRSTASRCRGVVRSLPPLPVMLRMRCSPLVLEIAHAEPDQLADAAAGIGQHREHGPVADADRDDSPGGVLDGRVVDLGASSKRRQSCGDRPTVLPSRDTAGAVTKLPWAGLAPL